MSFPPYSSSRQIPLSVFGLQPQQSQQQPQNPNQQQQPQQPQQPITYHFPARSNTSNSNSNTHTHDNMNAITNHNHHTFHHTTSTATSASASASSSSSCSSLASSPVVTRPLTSYTNLGSPILSASQVIIVQPPILPITPTPLAHNSTGSNNNNNDDKSIMKPPESINTKVSSSKTTTTTTTTTTTAAANTSSIGTGSAVRPRSYSMGSAPTTTTTTIGHNQPTTTTTPMGWHNNNTSNTFKSSSTSMYQTYIPSPPLAAVASTSSVYANRQRSLSNANNNSSKVTSSSSWTASPTRSTSSAVRHSTSLIPLSSSSLEGSGIITETSCGLANERIGIDSSLLIPSPPSSSEQQQSEEERRAVDLATTKERQRICSLEINEKQMTADELRLVLKQERHRLLSVLTEFTVFKVQTISNQLQAEIAEELRVNTLVNQLNTVEAEKERIIIELEREEEMISNTLQRKLFEVRKEKLLLEQKIERERHQNSNSTITTGISNNDDYYQHQQQHQEEVVPFSFSSVSALDSPTTTTDAHDDSIYGVVAVGSQLSSSNTERVGGVGIGRGQSSGGLPVLQSDSTKSTKTISPKRMKTTIVVELPTTTSTTTVQTAPVLPSLLVEDTHTKQEATT